MSSFQKEMDPVNLFLNKQEDLLPLALNEMYLTCKPLSNWFWWTFPSFKIDQNHPEPRFHFNYENMLHYLDSHPPEWKLILRRIIKTLHFLRLPLIRIFPSICHKHIHESIKSVLRVLSSFDDPNFLWLHEYFIFLKRNFNHYQLIL